MELYKEDYNNAFFPLIYFYIDSKVPIARSEIR
jgi:hypothetical protein